MPRKKSLKSKIKSKLKERREKKKYETAYEVAKLINEKIAGEKGVDWDLGKRKVGSVKKHYVVIYLYKNGKKKRVYIPATWFKFRGKRPVAVILEKLLRDYSRTAKKKDALKFSRYGTHRIEHSDPFGRI